MSLFNPLRTPNVVIVATEVDLVAEAAAIRAAVARVAALVAELPVEAVIAAELVVALVGLPGAAQPAAGLAVHPPVGADP